MKKWNMIVDVAKCTNCKLCTLATMDEYVGNECPGYSAPMPKHGHHWIDILQKERGQVPMIDIAYLPVMCKHCDNAPCIARRAARSRSATTASCIIDPVKAKGRKDLVDACPYGDIWWNEELQLPQHWPFDAHLIDQGWTADARPAVLPDRRHARAQGRGRGDGADGARGRARGDASPSSAPSRASTTATCGAMRNASSAARSSAEANGVVDCVEGARVRLMKDGRVRRRDDERQLRRLQVRPARRELRRLRVEIEADGGNEEDGRGKARRKHQSRRDHGCRLSPSPRLRGEGGEQLQLRAG